MASELTVNGNENLMNVSTGSVSFEVVLEPSKTNAVASPRILQSPSAKFSYEEIQAKLKLAEERRASFELEKIEKAKVESKLSGAEQRREALTEEFRKSTKQEIEKKIHTVEENRERLIKERIDKIREHEKHVEEVRKAKGNVTESAAAVTVE